MFFEGQKKKKNLDYFRYILLLFSIPSFIISKLKQFADNNFRFDEDSKKFSKEVENTVGKGEIACYKACFPGASKGVIVWEWFKSLPNNNILD